MRENRNARFLKYLVVTAREPVHLDSPCRHPAPPKKGIFLKQVGWSLMFCSEKVDPS